MAHDILIVDDEPDIRLLIDGILRDEGYETRGAGDADAAIAAFRVRRPSLVDPRRLAARLAHGRAGLLEAFHSEEPHVPVVMISGHGTIEMAVQAIQQGAYDFIEKPFKSDRLLLVVRRALEAAALARENAELRLRAGPEAVLTGDSAAIGGLRAGVERVAPTGSRVLIQGPAGCGKEVVARMIHARSRRADGPFVVLNCATLNPAPFRGGAVRPGGRHRSDRAAASRRRAGARAWRHAAAGRGLRHAAGDPGQDRARAAGSDVRAARRLGAREGRCARAVDHQQGPAGARSPPGGSARTCITGWRWCR